MKMDKLAPTVMALLMIAMIIAVGVLLMDKTSKAVQESTAVVDEAVTFTAGAGTVTNTPLLTLGAVGVHANTSTYALTVGNLETGEIVAADSFTGDLDVDYTYGADTASSLALDSGKDAVGTLSTDWMGLIITIIVLTLILGMVVVGFGYAARVR